MPDQIRDALWHSAASVSVTHDPFEAMAALTAMARPRRLVVVTRTGSEDLNALVDSLQRYLPDVHVSIHHDDEVAMTGAADGASRRRAKGKLGVLSALAVAAMAAVPIAWTVVMFRLGR